MSEVKVYTSQYCGFCTRAKLLLEQEDIPFLEIDITGDREARVELIERSKGQRTVPQIFVGQTHVGGFSELLALYRSGELAPLLEAEGINS
jgi:glutaredoxin 3